MEPTHSVCVLNLALTAEEWELIALFLKRAGYYTYRTYAQTDDDGHAMFAAAENLRRALSQVGFNLR